MCCQYLSYLCVWLRKTELEVDDVVHKVADEAKSTDWIPKVRADTLNDTYAEVFDQVPHSALWPCQISLPTSTLAPPRKVYQQTEDEPAFLKVQVATVCSRLDPR